MAQKNDVLNYLLSKFENGEEEIYSRIMAMACAEILGQDSSMMSESGSQWYESYLVSNEVNDNDKKNDLQKETMHQIEIAPGIKQEINPTGDGISNLVTGTRRKELTEMLKKVKADGPGVGLWENAYIGEDRIIFYNYFYLMTYNSMDKNKGIYNIIDYSKLNVGSIQGSLITEFIVSPNGQYYWKNNNTLISAIHYRNQDDKPWEFKIVEVNVDTLKGKVVFQS